MVLLVLAAAVRLWPKTDQVQGHAYPVPSGASGLVVEVLNGTDRRGLARAASRALRREGHDVVFFGNAPAPAESTTIVVRRGKPSTGERLRTGLGVGVVDVQPDSLRRVDASVILGPDYQPPLEVHP